MKSNVLILFLAIVFVAPALAGASMVTEKDFEVKTTRDLINLCTASADDPKRAEAIHFCHGYLVGAFAYNQAEYSGTDAKPMICLPNPNPSRNEAINMFVDWAKAHPQYMNEKPVETEFRFLTEKWPCKQ
jgi:hypothetical protein